MYGLREGLKAAEPYTKGFRLVVLTGHKNNLFTGALLANKRVNKKLLRWAIDVEEMGDRIQRIWIKGTENILGDAPSRNPPDRDVCRDLPVPSGPVRRIIRQMFEAPVTDSDERDRLDRFVEGLDVSEPTRSDEKVAVATPAGLATPPPQDAERHETEAAAEADAKGGGDEARAAPPTQDTAGK